VATGLEAPWGLAFVPDGRLLVTERPGRIRVVKDRTLDPQPVATLTVVAAGEAGLMGIVSDPGFSQNQYVYVCYTTQKPGRLVNRVARLTVQEGRAGDAHVILDDVPGAVDHDGCRLKFGPDGKLYVTTGDAAQPRLAQQRDSLAGKIPRLNPDGTIPRDNPLPDSPVYSLGHRNPQGIAWDPAGRLFAAEHGPGGHDEVNVIVPGANYGWPEVQGRAANPCYTDPIVESEDDVWNPSGIAFRSDDLYVATLRGRRLLRVTFAPDLTSSRVTTLLDRSYGRLRDVIVGPDHALYVATSNRDGRGQPTSVDDRILRVIP
jgi:glucose/arabinose dehydrogenase